MTAFADEMLHLPVKEVAPNTLIRWHGAGSHLHALRRWNPTLYPEAKQKYVLAKHCPWDSSHLFKTHREKLTQAHTYIYFIGYLSDFTCRSSKPLTIMLLYPRCPRCATEAHPEQTGLR